MRVRETAAGLVAEAADGTELGRATLVEVPWRGAGWVELDLSVRPAHRGAGVGAALWAATRPLLAGASVVAVETLDRRRAHPTATGATLSAVAGLPPASGRTACATTGCTS